MHRLLQSRHQSTVYRLTGFEVTASLRRNTWCLSVILFYGVRMKIRLCVSVQGADCFLSFLKLTRTSFIGDRPLLSSKRSSLQCNAWEMFELWRTIEVGSLSSRIGWHLICRENLNEKTSAYMIPRQLGKRGSSDEEGRVLAYASFFFFLICRRCYSLDHDVGQFAVKWLAFIAMKQKRHKTVSKFGVKAGMSMPWFCQPNKWFCKLVAQQCAQVHRPLEPSVVMQAPLRTTPCCALCARAVLDSVHWSFFS